MEPWRSEARRAVRAAAYRQQTFFVVWRANTDLNLPDSGSRISDLVVQLDCKIGHRWNLRMICVVDLHIRKKNLGLPFAFASHFAPEYLNAASPYRENFKAVRAARRASIRCRP